MKKAELERKLVEQKFVIEKLLDVISELPCALEDLLGDDYAKVAKYIWGEEVDDEILFPITVQEFNGSREFEYYPELEQELMDMEKRNGIIFTDLEEFMEKLKRAAEVE